MIQFGSVSQSVYREKIYIFIKNKKQYNNFEILCQFLNKCNTHIYVFYRLAQNHSIVEFPNKEIMTIKVLLHFSTSSFKK